MISITLLLMMRVSLLKSATSLQHFSYFLSVASVDLKIAEKSLHVSLLYNPSHLEAVNPVSMGKTRAKQMMVEDGDYSTNRRWSDKILNLQVWQ